MNQFPTCPDCGQPFCPDCGQRHPGSVGAAKGVAKASNAAVNQRPAPIVPWGTWESNPRDLMPGIETASWKTTNPKNGKRIIQELVDVVYKDVATLNSLALHGYSEGEIRKLIESWALATWATPWSLLSTIPSFTRVNILFMAWVYGWDLTFGGTLQQPCSYILPHSGSSPSNATSTGYVWDCYQRKCVKAGSQQYPGIVMKNATATPSTPKKY